METRLQAVEAEIARLKKDLLDLEKALEEGSVVFGELNQRHQQNVTKTNLLNFCGEFNGRFYLTLAGHVEDQNSGGNDGDSNDGGTGFSGP